MHHPARRSALAALVAATGLGVLAALAACGAHSGTGARAADIALSLTSAGRLRLQVTTVDAKGAPLSTTLRLSVGPAEAPGGTVILTDRSLAVHRLTMPALAPGRAYLYDLTVTAHGLSRTYPSQGRYRFTAPASPTQPLTILYWGDSRPDSLLPGAPEPRAFTRLVSSALARSSRPTLALAGGDLINAPLDTSPPSLDQKYAVFAAAENRLARLMPVMAAPGNHENPTAPQRSAAWRRWFTFPTSADPHGLYYSFNDGDAHIVVLDSASAGGSIGYYGPNDPRDSAQAKWLVTDLRKSAARWTIVMLHHPLFDGKPTDPWSTTARSERVALAKLFASSGVDLVLQGHIHNYRRHEEPVSKGSATYQLAYITEGGGGAPLYSTTTAPLDGHDIKAYSAYGYLILHSDGAGKLTAAAYKVDPSTGATSIGDRFAVDQVPRGTADQGAAK